jgi:glycosyltransferase involved in cell wall biosynthesis
MHPAGPTLIIQIPCWNEEEALPTTLAALPRTVAGIGKVEILVISDGSTDRTVEVARNLKVEHILDFKHHQGLAKTFTAGLSEASRLGADYVVNLDADNQYCADDIPKLLAPLLEGQADVVVGERPIRDIEHFSAVKKKLQRFGSWTVRRLSGVDVKDTPSGFRAYNRRAMLRLFIFNEHTYTQESLISATDSGLHVVGVPIRVNPGVMRPSRLMKSIGHYVLSSAGVILRFYLVYKPRGVFLGFALLSGLAGAGLWVRFLYFYFTGNGGGHVQSLVLAAVLLTAGMLSFILAVVADIMRTQRRLLQEILSLMRDNAYRAHHEERDKEP